MGVRRAVRRLWDTYRLFRWASCAIGALSATGLGGALVGLAYRWRRLGEIATDSPEFGGEEHLLPTVAMPRIVVPSWLPWLAVPVVLIALVWLATHLPMRRPDNGFERDPHRLFTDADRAWIDSCTGRRCEHRTLGLFRCRYAAEQLDHWYPWAKGGATDRHNLVNLCARHNRRKTDHVPTWLQTALLARARMKYFPPRWRGYVRPDGLSHEEETEER